MVKRSQTSEFLAADICDSPSLFVTTAATAGTLSSFQRMCGNDMDISTVTAAFPSGSSVLAPNPSYCHKFPESLTCKVFCHRSTSGRFSRIHPQLSTVPLTRRLVFTFISFPQSQRHSHIMYRFSRSSSLFSTVRCPNLWPSSSSPLFIFFIPYKKQRYGRKFFSAAPLFRFYFLSVFCFFLAKPIISNTAHPETQITAIHFPILVLSPVFGMDFT